MGNFDILSGQVLIKAGKNVSTDFTDGTEDEELTGFISGACSVVNVNCRHNFSDDYSTLNADVKQILQEVATNLAAIYCIQYDMSGFTTRTEAEDMVNILRDAVLRGLSILRDKKAQDFINGT